MSTHASTSNSPLRLPLAPGFTTLAAVVLTGAAETQALPDPETVYFNSDGAKVGEGATRMDELHVEERRERELASPKFTVPLRDVPQTITVVPQRIIEEQGATSLRDILRNSPGITFQAGEGGTPAGDQMTIRGFSARTDIFIDGIRDLGGYARDAFNLEQVEIAKGPSSAVAGRGSTGGSVNLVTKTPKAEQARSATFGVGTDNYLRGTIDVNQPLAKEGAAPTAAFRFNAMATDADVPGRDVVTNQSWGVAPAITFGLNQPTQLTLAYQHLEQDNMPDYGLPRQVFDYDPPVSSENYYGLTARDYERVDQDLATVTVEHHNSNGLTLRNLTRFGRTYRDSIITAPRFVSGSTDTIRRSDWKSRDQVDEVLANHTNLTAELATGAITHELSLGLEVSRERTRNHTRVEQPGVILPDTNVYSPNPDDPYTGNIERNGDRVEGTGDTLAVYAFDTVHLNDQWQVTGGLRLDDFDAKQDTVAGGVTTTTGRRDREVSGRIGVVYKPTTAGSLYAGYANSFNPSAEGLSLSDTLLDLEPETTRTYEVGAKWGLLDSRLSLTAALFRSEKTNARTPGLDPNDPPQVLAGKQRVDGVELSAAGRITPDWEVFAGLALMDSEIIASNNASEAGAALARTPEATFNLWTTYRLPANFTVGLGTQYMDTVYRSTTTTDSVPDYWLVNAMAAWEATDRLTLRLNVSNLLDEEYIDRVGGGHHIPGPARQFILTAELGF